MALQNILDQCLQKDILFRPHACDLLTNLLYFMHDNINIEDNIVQLNHNYHLKNTEQYNNKKVNTETIDVLIKCIADDM